VTTVPAAPAGTRHNLTDAQWALLESLLPAPPHRGRPRRWPLRNLVDGIFFRVRTGIPCRDVPERYGPWWRIYDLFLRFRRTGVWAAVHTRLLTAAHRQEMLTWEVSVDSTTSRGHVHATGTRPDSHRRHPGEPTDHGFGWSRGGWSTKIHLAVDSGGGGVLSFPLTAGQSRDAPQLVPVLEQVRVPAGRPGRPRNRPVRVLADKAYSSRAIRRYLRGRGTPATIAQPVDQVRHRLRRGPPVAVPRGSIHRSLRGSECVAEGGATAVCHNM
jgi:transposase